MRKNPATVLSFLALLVLIVIQVYIILSYYKIKSRNFDMTYSRAFLTTLENSDSQVVDTLNFAFNAIAASFILSNLDTLNSAFQREISGKFDSLLIRYDENSPRLKAFLIAHNLDTVFQSRYEIRDIDLLVFENKVPVYRDSDQKPQEKSRGIYIKSYSKEGDYYAIRYDYYIDLSYKPKIILSEMKGLLFLVILTLSGVIVAFLYTLVTLRRQKKLSELKDDFIDHITHEFKTPLSVISVAVSSLKDQRIPKEDPRFFETCIMLEKQNKLLSGMIDNVIDTSLLDRRAIDQHKKAVPLKKFIQDVVTLFCAGQEATGRPVSLLEEYRLPDDYEYRLDPVQFNRVLNNLFSNAVKYCERDPCICLRVSVDKQVRIEITDNGIGIREEHLPHIFTKFYRADNPGKVKGLGLGLYIVRRIIENHQGTIELESSWGIGTTVNIILPK